MTIDFKKQAWPMVAVDLVIFTIIEKKLNVLLVKIKYGPFKGQWAVPGGKVPINETLDQTATRELREETGMKNVYLEQLYSFGELERDPRARTVSVAYFALVDSTRVKLKTTEKYYDIKWATIESMGKLAYDHSQIVAYALERLRYKLEYTNAVYSLLPEKFTLTGLQKVYEIVLGRKLDKRNFRKKMLATKLIKETGKETNVPHRPPKLYSFRVRKPMIMEMF